MRTPQGLIDDAHEKLAENPWRESPQVVLKLIAADDSTPEELRSQARAVLDQAAEDRAALEVAGTPGAPDDLWPGYSDDAPAPEGWQPPEPTPDADGIVTITYD